MVRRTAGLLASALLVGACSSHAIVDGPSTTTAAPQGKAQFPANAQLAASHLPRAAATIGAGDVPALVAGNSRFAFDLYQRLAAANRGANLVFSPASISNAIAMLEGGARGGTMRQIDATLHFTLPEAKLHDAFNALDQMLAAPRHATPLEQGTPLKLEQTDAVWGQRDFSFVRSYLDLLARDYGAGLRLADFERNAEAERVKINAYVANATHGRIKELFGRGVIDNTTRMVLVNAIWFKGAWQSPFSPGGTAPRPFTRLDGSTVNVPMMSGASASRVLTTGDYQAVELPYVGGASMVIVEPGAGKFAGVERRFGPAVLADFDRRAQSDGTQVSMPKFDFASQFSLNDTLAAMGMPDAFGAQADLSGIDGQHDLFVSAVVHQATIKVDEKGTEAAAATGIAVTDSAIIMRHAIALDHPFLFAIRDTKTGAILFAGRVLDPTQH